jgi:type IX secretion system PorP/SprF family membrane protein
VKGRIIGLINSFNLDQPNLLLMRFHPLPFLACLLLCFQTSAQQEFLSSYFWSIQNYFIPALTGLENQREGVILARDQWLGVSGQPRTLQFQYAQRIKEHSGIGMIVQLDKIGFNQTQKLKVPYAYHLKMKNKGILSFGASATFFNLIMNSNWVPPTSTPDLVLPPNHYRQFNVGMDFGLNYTLSKWAVGTGITQLKFQNRNDFFDWKSYLFLLTSYQLRLSENATITPRLLVQANSLNVVATLNVQFNLLPFLQFGVSARNTKFIGANLNFKVFRHYYLGYSGEFYSLISGNRWYSHEAVLGFVIPNGTKERK